MLRVVSMEDGTNDTVLRARGRRTIGIVQYSMSVDSSVTSPVLGKGSALRRPCKQDEHVRRARTPCSLVEKVFARKSSVGVVCGHSTSGDVTSGHCHLSVVASAPKHRAGITQKRISRCPYSVSRACSNLDKKGMASTITVREASALVDCCIV